MDQCAFDVFGAFTYLTKQNKAHFGSVPMGRGAGVEVIRCKVVGMLRILLPYFKKKGGQQHLMDQ